MQKLQRKRVEAVLPLLGLSSRSKILKGGENMEKEEDLVKRHLCRELLPVQCSHPPGWEGVRWRGVPSVISSPGRQFSKDRLSLHPVALGLTSP